MSRTTEPQSGTQADPVAKPDGQLLSPFVVIVDTREQVPFGFENLRTDANLKYRPIAVQTVREALPSGDYSLRGHEHNIAVERKSLADLFSTLSSGRARFERELARLNLMQYAAVVIEADWETILMRPPERSLLNPKTVFRSILAWQQRFIRVHWWAVPGRRMAEAVTFRILERFWKDVCSNVQN